VREITFSINPQKGQAFTVLADGRVFTAICVSKTDDYLKLEIPSSNGSAFVDFKRNGNKWIVLDSYTDEENRSFKN
jgi:hypothetical protein